MKIKFRPYGKYSTRERAFDKLTDTFDVWCDMSEWLDRFETINLVYIYYTLMMKLKSDHYENQSIHGSQVV